MANIVGPGAIKVEETAPEPSLNKFSEFQYVEVLNPLSDDFMVQVAQDVPVNVPFEIRHDSTGRVQYLSTTEAEVRTNYGLSLKNSDHQAKKQIYNNTVIPAGKTKVFRGNEAQVVVRQLVNEILQRRGKKSKLLMSNPNLRKEVEQEIIVRTGDVQELLDSNFQTEQQQVSRALNNINEATNEFPELETTGSAAERTDSVSRNDSRESEKKVGRPKKTA